MNYPKRARVLIQFSFEPSPELFAAMTTLSEKLQGTDYETTTEHMFTLVSDTLGLNASEQKIIPQMLSLSGSEDERVTDNALHEAMMHKCLEEYQKQSGRSALESLLTPLRGFSDDSADSECDCPNCRAEREAEPSVN